MSATAPCVRCAQMPEDHPHPLIAIENGELRRHHCPQYVSPAPWWMRAAIKLIEAISRRAVR